ncbi:MAG TPA: LuxR C-terminal-related transcriptional regulator [Anaerolineae bacterium]
MSLDRLALGRVAHPAKPSATSRDEPRREFIGSSALAFVRHTTASWRGFRVLERSVLEGALALARQGHGQVLFVAMHGLRSFADRRLDLLEVRTIGPSDPWRLARELLRAATARPDSRSAASSLPADLLAYLKTPAETPSADGSVWPDAIAGFIAALPARGPLMIVIDHAHHADADSLRVIEALACRVAASRILLVITYRIDAPLNAELGALMHELREKQLARSMVIASPQTNDVRLMFQLAFDRSMRPESAASALASDSAGLLMHGLTAVEACRRAGRWPDAKTLAEHLIEAGEANKVPYVACAASIVLGHILADQGKWDESLERLEHIQPIVETIKEDDLIAWLYWGLARAHWGKSDRRHGFQMLRLAHTVAGHISDAALAASIALCGVEWLADNRRVRASQDWLAAVERLAEQTTALTVNAIHSLASGIVALAEGEAIAATGHFRAALRQWTIINHEYVAARVRLRLASALLARDDAECRRDGREELSDAHAIFTRLGAAHDVSLVEAIGAKYGIRPRARRAASSGSTSPGGITPREREVLELLVKGMTNRQIAATLSITEKTAEGHVSNILAKLGVASRGQAAGYAVANGLLESAEAS